MRISDWSSDVCSSDLLSCLTVVHIPSSATWYLAHICELVAHLSGNCRCDGKWSRDFHILVRNLCREVGAESGIHHALHGRVAGEAMAQLRRLPGRSEEHTSELQPLMRISYAVFCLTKKNNTYHDIA